MSTSLPHGKVDAPAQSRFGVLRTRRFLVLAGTAAVLVVFLLVFVIWLVQPHSEAERDARDVASSLQALSTDPASLVPASLNGQIAPQIAQAVPKGTTVSVDEKSWHPDGHGGGIVLVTLTAPGGKPTTFLALLAKEKGKWKVLSTSVVTADSK
jgi:hypothetical protein